MTIEEFNFQGKRTFVRVDFNVPLNDKGEITDDTRMCAALPTLQKVMHDKGKLIIASHLGRPKKVTPELSLKHLLPHLEELLGQKVMFVDDCIGSKVTDAIKQMQDGDVLLLENLRFYEEEEGKPRNLPENATEEDKKAAKTALKEKQKQFAKALADLADCYVNDAFGTAHRAHASTALIADYFDAQHKMFGFLMQKEVTAVENVQQKAQHPYVAIVGGSKVSSKIGIIENLLDKVDTLIITGGMAFTFIAARKGAVGKSICEEDKFDLALSIEQQAKAKNVKLVLPVDVVAAKEFSNDVPTQVFKSDDIPHEYMGLDVGPETVELYKSVLKGARTILWNGPAGVFEMENFRKGTNELAHAVCSATKEGAYSLVGGGDSVACVKLLGLEKQMSYVSTGGGALLEAIEGKVLPGIKAIQG